MIYFTSDLHFYNKKVSMVGNRIFDSIQEKNEFLIKQWNEVVTPEDEVYLLGDISDGNASETNEILKRLNGTKYLIIGNHDKYLEDSEFDKSLYAWYQPYYILRIKETKFILFHFPIEVWEGYRNDRIHLHGHLHRKKATFEPIRRYEVGVDAHDGRPVSIEEVWDSIKEFHNRNRNISGTNF